ncbi:MAG TPA: LysR family transcriptional regulator [Pseudonocardia sp.]
MRADDLLILLEVARCGSLAGAGAALGLNHATVSRRLSALERDVGRPVLVRGPAGCHVTDLGRALLEASERVENAVAEVYRHSKNAHGERALSGLVRITAPEGFAAAFVAPVLARVHREHPAVVSELVTTARLPVHGTGADIEIGVGAPLIHRGNVEILTAYELGLYASEDYLAARGTPTSTADLAVHSFVYYIDSLLRIEDGDLALTDAAIPGRAVQIGSTSIHAHVAAAAAGGGIGLLPAFLADRHANLRRVLSPAGNVQARFRVALAPERLRRPATILVMEEIRREVNRRRHELLPQTAPGAAQRRQPEEIL